MEIRRANPNDAEDLFVLNELFNGKGSTTVERIRRSLAQNADEIVCVAVIDGECVGFCCGAVMRSLCYSDSYGDITELYVHSAHRQKGAGLALMRFMESALWDLGVRHFHLKTGIRNATAQALYKKLGYARSGYAYSKHCSATR